MWPLGPQFAHRCPGGNLGLTSQSQHSKEQGRRPHASVTFLLLSSSGERTETLSAPPGQTPERPRGSAAGGQQESQEKRYQNRWCSPDASSHLISIHLFVLSLFCVFFSPLTSTSFVSQGHLAAAPAAAPSTPLPWCQSPTVLTAARRLTSPSRIWWLWGRAEHVSTTSTTSGGAPPLRHHRPHLLLPSWHRTGWRSCTSSSTTMWMSPTRIWTGRTSWSTR